MCPLEKPPLTQLAKTRARLVTLLHHTMFASLVKLHLRAWSGSYYYPLCVYISRIILLFDGFIRFAITNVFRTNIINWLCSIVHLLPSPPARVYCSRTRCLILFLTLKRIALLISRLVGRINTSRLVKQSLYTM